MTDKSQASGTGAVPTPELKPLPQLKVLRDTYCSQEMTDSCIKYLEEHRPDLLQALLFEEEFLRDFSYFKVLGNIISFLLQDVAGDIPVPQGHMGMIDFVFELSRRLRTAYNLIEIKPLGKSLAPRLEGPFPALVPMKIDIYSKKMGLTQEVADVVLSAYYKKRPDLWFIAGEQCRYQVSLYTFSDECQEALRKIVIQAGVPVAVHDTMIRKSGDLPSLVSALGVEMGRRVRRMCDINNPEA